MNKLKTGPTRELVREARRRAEKEEIEGIERSPPRRLT